MAETKEEKESKKEKKPLTLSRPGKLELKKTVESGTVRQSFSHGRSKVVAVEVRKKRTFTQDSDGQMTEVKRLSQEAQDLGLEQESSDADAEASEATLRSTSIAGLTEQEKAARVRALQDAGSGSDQAAPPPNRFEPVKTDTAEEPPAEETPAEGQEAAPKSAEAREKEEEEQRERTERAKASAAAAAAKLREHETEEEGEAKRARSRPGVKPAPSLRRGERRRAGKLTITTVVDGEEAEERTRSLASVRRAREKQRKKERQSLQDDPSQKIFREVTVPETITVQELANRMAERSVAVIKTLMKMDVMATANQVIDADTAELVVTEFGHKIKRVSESDVEIGLGGTGDTPETLKSRPPVVTVMGHVDHGKTSLLDALRETDIVSGEAGGITQHIGAYQVTMASGDKITFIDTPGHAAFTEMRSRGAKATDIVVLVVAADDGIMPQTIEALDHAKAAGVPIIVAINKMDRPDANPQRVRTDLLQHDIVVEEMGGEILNIEVSAKAKTNLDKLEEAILLQSEILDLKANPDRPAEGVIIEAKVERGRGSVATVLVQRGTLKVGDIVIAGGEWGRVRAMLDAYGTEMAEAGPSMPVEILGLNGTPAAGDEVVVVDSENRAREVCDFRQRKEREKKVAASARGTLEQMFEKIQDGSVEAKELPVVIKADVHGSVEAIVNALEGMSTEEVRIKILHAGVGGINESDVILAQASQALIIGFNVRANPQARTLARRDNVEIRYYSIIYDLTDDLKKALSGLLAPTIRERIIGNAEILEVFNVSKVGKVAGCRVTDGQVRRGAKVRLVRDDVIIHEGDLAQLKRFRDDAREVQAGNECGMAFANYQDIKVGDTIECFEVEEITREL
ncbi:MAG: translation initiation factor IF-2 [Rhodospirillales bacterium]